MPASEERRSAGPQSQRSRGCAGAGAAGGVLGRVLAAGHHQGGPSQLCPTARLPELALVPHGLTSQASSSAKTGFLAPELPRGLTPGPRACRCAAPAPLGQQPRPPLLRCSEVHRRDHSAQAPVRPMESKV